jgi:hypothetical protein
MIDRPRNRSLTTYPCVRYSSPSSSPVSSKYLSFAPGTSSLGFGQLAVEIGERVAESGVAEPAGGFVVRML